MTHAHHHLHRRKRIHVRHEIYPHPNPWKRFLDRAVLFVGVAAPLMTFSQVWTIWTTKSAESISPATWGMYFIASIVWLIYGLAHRELPIVISNTLYVVATALVLVGIAIF